MTNAFNDNISPDERVDPDQVETLVVTIPSGSTDTIEVPLGDEFKYVKYFCEEALWIAPTEAGLTAEVISADPAISKYAAVPEFGGKQGGEVKQKGEFSTLFVKPMTAPSADATLYLILGDA